MSMPAEDGSAIVTDVAVCVGSILEPSVVFRTAFPQSSSSREVNLLAVAAVTLAVAYIGWKITQSPDQALQFAFNGISVGAVYALLAMGFTLVYSTVWFFDLYYGAAAAMGAYGVFYPQVA